MDSFVRVGVAKVIPAGKREGKQCFQCKLMDLVVCGAWKEERRAEVPRIDTDHGVVIGAALGIMEIGTCPKIMRELQYSATNTVTFFFFFFFFFKSSFILLCGGPYGREIHARNYLSK
jgi:hypothetical protein